MEEDKKNQDIPETNANVNTPSESVKEESASSTPTKAHEEEVKPITENKPITEDKPKVEEHKEEIKVVPASSSKESKPVNWKMIAGVLGAIILLVFLVWGYQAMTSPTGQVVKGPAGAELSSGSVKLDFYVMSQCPYGTQVVDAIAPVLAQLGNDIDFNLNFISTDLGDGEFKSLHGEPETKGNIVQLCAAKYNPNKYIDMIVCQNKDAKSIPDNWEGCATGLNVESIKACYEGTEGRELLSENVKLASEVGATGSPTIYLNDKPYSGGRSEGNFLRALCDAFETRPAACSDLPQAVKFEAIILNDKRCAECDTTGLVGQIKGLFPGMTIKNVDYDTVEGQVLYKDLKIDFLPAVLFDKKVETAENYENIKNFVDDKKDYYNLKIGSSWDPNKEICDNNKDDNEDGKVDCDDPSCDGNIACMEKKAVPEVELFIMSHCPYGTQTEKGMLPVMQLLGDKADIKVKFVDYAMHDKKELDEQLVQYCIQEEQESKYLTYLECFLEEGNTDECLAETKIDTDDLDKCVLATDNEFKVTELYNDKSTWSGGRFPQFNIHKVENEKYGIKGSPGLAVNGVKIDSFGRDPASLLTIVCQAFKEKPAECDEPLNSASPSAGFGFNAASAAAAPAAGGCGV